MSRSRKKNPYVGICGVKRQTQKFFKKVKNRCIRRSLNQNTERDGNAYTKELNGMWMLWPSDGRQRWDEPKGYRK